MRQKFDVGDLVYCPLGKDQKESTGIVIRAELINNYVSSHEQLLWHVDEYHCRVHFVNGEYRWVRAKWLKHFD